MTVIYCWQYSHKNTILLSIHQEKKLIQKIPKLKAVCPTCKSLSLGNMPIVVTEGNTLIMPQKLFVCCNNHLTIISAFTNGFINIKFGHNIDDFINIECQLDQLKDSIDKMAIVCYNNHCEQKLQAIDNIELVLPSLNNIKTKTRVGDLWDKHNIEPVRPGSYTKDGYYQESSTEKANKERLNRMRNRNLPIDKLPGKRISKSTNIDYGYKSKNEINPERLK